MCLGFNLTVWLIAITSEWMLKTEIMLTFERNLFKPNKHLQSSLPPVCLAYISKVYSLTNSTLHDSMIVAEFLEKQAFLRLPCR